MKLYYFESSNPRKACAVAKYLGSPVEFVRIDLGKGENKTPRFLAINPNGKVPALTDGETRIWEANAIMAYLARAAGSDLWPRQDDRQIELTRWLSWNASHFTRHAATLVFEHLIKPNFLGRGPDPKVVDEATGLFKQFAAVLDEHLGGRTYILGDTLTIADFAVAGALPDADRAKIPIEGFTAIERWHARLNELPAWREPFPARPQTRAA
ncbi:MAG: glutathione S-transferase family protein [Hyphomicrobiaceae bacterium]|nr:glutathione S-transferase family protein [Hyphomicrobiaceae bacterium]